MSDVPLLGLCQSSLLWAVGGDASLGAFHDLLVYPSHVVTRSSLNNIVKTVLAFTQVDEMEI